MPTMLIKRSFDICISGIALLAASPLMGIVALVIRFDTPGPVLFRQLRVGRGGQPFHIFKFRTMIDRPAAGNLEITVDHDPRITRSGKFLRHWKLDELPQLWNVFRGDMSIVGPRPEVPKYVALYPEHERRLVLGVRPGITDPASIKYRSESEILAASADPEKMYREVILPDKLALAVDYAGNVSLFRDFAIILKTILKVAR